jgi:cysteine desulfurase family protein (TIGR01976 family)
MSYDLSTIYEQFPSCNRIINGQRVVYLDGPAGTQVPQRVIQAISDYYKNSNANVHGQFVTSKETDNLLVRTRTKVADFLGAENGDTISFGQNMTSLIFVLSQAIGRTLIPGDQIVITQLDHEANRGPWLQLERQGIEVSEVAMKQDGTLDYDDFDQKVSDKTRIIAIGYASNIFGTANDLVFARNLADKTGAKLVVDAVHAAPHFKVNVQSIKCDFLLCSAYKFYGPHIGILYSKPGELDLLPTLCLRTQDQTPPFKIETGTLNHAAIAGVEAAIEFIASLGNGTNLAMRISNAMDKIHEHEMRVVRRLAEGIADLEKVSIIGPSLSLDKRAPTISFTHSNLKPRDICCQLAEKGIFAWDGHFYAISAVEALGLVEKGGVTRMGIVMYNTLDDVDRTLEALCELES